MHFFPDHVFDCGRNAWRESPKKKRDALKTAFLTKESIKKFHKSKINGLQKLSTRAPWFYDILHFKGWTFINHKTSQQTFGKFRFLNLRSLKYIIIVQKINISTIGNFFIFFLGFQTLWGVDFPYHGK